MAGDVPYWWNMTGNSNRVWQDMPVQTGWQCPVCGKVMSPYTNTCRNDHEREGWDNEESENPNDSTEGNE